MNHLDIEWREALRKEMGYFLMPEMYPIAWNTPIGIKLARRIEGRRLAIRIKAFLLDTSIRFRAWLCKKGFHQYVQLPNVRYCPRCGRVIKNKSWWVASK